MEHRILACVIPMCNSFFVICNSFQLLTVACLLWIMELWRWQIQHLAIMQRFSVTEATPWTDWRSLLHVAVMLPGLDLIAPVRIPTINCCGDAIAEVNSLNMFSVSIKLLPLRKSRCVHSRLMNKLTDAASRKIHNFARYVQSLFIKFRFSWNNELVRSVWEMFR